MDERFLDLAQRQGERLAARILSHDHLHLGPPVVRKAVAARLRAGVKALEAYLRRVLMLLALMFEPGLKARGRFRTADGREHRAILPSLPHLRIFTGERDCPDWLGDGWAVSGTVGAHQTGLLIDPKPLLARLSALQAVLADPKARARRLAFHMARYRPGAVLAPGAGRVGVARRYGTEVSALYTALGEAIMRLGRARPPPLGPVPRPPPRARWL